MRNACLTLGVVLLAGTAWNGREAALAQGNPAHTHMGHVMTGFRDTPDQQGLLPTAVAEAKVAAQHAALAARGLDNLNAMKTHAGHVLHAVDPTVETSGPGLGYGVKKAASGVVAHIGLAAKSEGASENVKLHATHVSTAATNVVERCDKIIALVARIRAAGSAADAAPLVTELAALADQLTAGVDANGDGRIGWQAGEGGLQHAQQHMELMQKGEGGLLRQN